MKRSYECFLGHVPRLLAVVKYLVGQATHALSLLLDQGLERRRISGDAALDELPLVDSRGLGRFARPGGARWGVGRRHGPRRARPATGLTRPLLSRPLSDRELDGRKGARIHGRRRGPTRGPRGVTDAPPSSASTPSREPAGPHTQIQ